jgi:DNA-binding response OmpR family regulator
MQGANHMNTRLLIIDDDPKLNHLLTDYLTEFGYQVKTAVSPSQGLTALQQDPPDLLILDVMLPEINGFDLCKKIRRDSNIPIIMLTARGDPMDRILGLELGADDYLPKPFEPRELVARIQAVRRRTSAVSPKGPKTFGRLSLEEGKRQVLLDGNILDLTTNEYNALALLMRHAGQVLDRDQILQTLRGMDSDAFNRSVDITMSRVRQKLGDNPKAPIFIKTIWGTGYMFIGQPDDPGENRHD